MDKKNKNDELFGGITLSYLSTIISLGSTLLLTPIIIRLLGKSEYGLYETIGSFVNYLAIFDMGFSSVVTRYTAKFEAEDDPANRDKFLYTCRNVYRILAFVIALIGILIFINIDRIFGDTFTQIELSKARVMFLIVLATTIVSIYSQIYKGALNGVQKFIWPRVLTIIKTVTTKIVCILVLYLGSDSVGYTFVLLIFELLLFISVKIACLKYVNFTKNKMPIKQILELFNFTFFIFIQVIVAQLFWQVDKLLLGVLLGTGIVATYSVALNINNLVRNVSSAVRDVILPKATQMAIKSNVSNRGEELTKFMIMSGRVILIIYGIMAVGLSVLGDEFIYLWIGKEYLEVVSIMLVLVWGSLVPTIQSPGEDICRAHNKHKFLSVIYLFLATINVIFTWILIPKFGIFGAAIPTVVSMSIGNVVIANIYYAIQFNINILSLYHKTFNKLWSVLLVTGLIGYYINKLISNVTWFTFILEIIIISMIYLLGLILYGFNDFERKYFYKIIKKIVGRWLNEK